MKRAIVVLFAVLLLDPGTPASGAAKGSVPSLIQPQEADVAGPPIWVSAAALASGEVELAPEALKASSLLRRMGAAKKARATSPEVHAIERSECEELVIAYNHLDASRPVQSLKDLLESPDPILVGEVVHIEPGFFLGAPASLLEVRVRKWLRPNEAKERSETVYVYHPAAHFAVGSESFCSQSLVPDMALGDRLLVFDGFSKLTERRDLITPREDRIVLQTKDKLIVPPALKKNPLLSGAKDLDQVEAAVEKALLSSGEAQ